jgi:hypothetical protein
MNNSIIIIETLLKDPLNEQLLMVLKCLYQIMYVICKVRGYQTIIKFFSSEVHIFEPIITFLFTINPEGDGDWYMLYVCILWTSILGLVPFDIETIDTKGIIITQLSEFYRKALTFTSNIRDITAYALSKFFTRPDMIKKGLLENFTNHAVDWLTNDKLNENLFVDIGILAALCEIFKNGQPADTCKYIDPIIKNILMFNYPGFITNSGVIRKYLTKLTQRVGLSILKPKDQKWRYKIQLKTLKIEKTTEETQMDKDDEVMDSDNLDYDIDYENLEILIEKLLTYLMDKEYIVRWSAAKGIGRLCERLTKNMVDDICENIYRMFDDEDNEYSWHGGCLCFAELFKRGMILPEKIKDIIPFLEKALIYENNKGTFCSGSIVRDSACYVVWALARAYTKDIMKPYVERLARSLILTILFDKESNCRRAASAAFQEHVGRQGYFPYGIEIITEADFFTVGNRINCYLNIATYIAQYPEYYDAIVNYLCFNRLQHVEESIRLLAAESIALLVPFKPNCFVETIIPELIKLCYSNLINVRHGAIFGIGYILVGLSGKWDFEFKVKRIKAKVAEITMTEESEYRKKFEDFYSQMKFINNLSLIGGNLIESINNIVNNLHDKKLYQGKGSEIMRRAVNNLIRLICEAGMTIPNDKQLYYLDVLVDNLKHTNSEIQIEACDSLKILGNSFDTEIYNDLQKVYSEMLRLAIHDESKNVTKGFTMAIPHFNINIIKQNFNDVFNTLYLNAKTKTTTNNDYETRKAALESLVTIAIKYFNNNDQSITQEIDKIMTYLLEGLEDYEIDKKLGDVGAEVRKASIKGMTELLLCLFKTKATDHFNKYVEAYIAGAIKQLAEKMNKIRLTCGECLQQFFFELSKQDFEKTAVPYIEELNVTFLSDIKLDELDNVTNLSWLEPNYSYKKIIHFLLYKNYSLSLFEGLIISIGGITEDVQRCSLNALDDLLKETH